MSNAKFPRVEMRMSAQYSEIYGHYGNITIIIPANWLNHLVIIHSAYIILAYKYDSRPSKHYTTLNISHKFKYI